jgi:Tfp pilus assembly protein PilF
MHDLNTFGRSIAVATLITSLALLGACKTYQTGSTMAETSGAAAGDAVTLEAAMELWKERGTKEGLQRAIDALQAVVAAEPNNQDAMIATARAWYFMADGYTDTPEEKGPIFDKARDWGERAMLADAEYKARIDKGEKPAKAITALQQDDQMAIYWTASALGKWARIQGFSTLVKYKGYIAGMMEHCLGLDETVFYSGPIRYWATFYAVAPGFAGGDMTKSKEFYEKSIKMNPEYLATYVLFAEAYGRKAQDKELFKTNLQHVLDADVDATPELTPEHIVEQKKARMLLDNIDEYFAD